MPETAPRTAIVTGGSRGIGLGIATELAGLGFQVVCIARKPSEAFEAAAAQVRDAGIGALHFRAADLGEIDALGTLVRDIRKAHGPIHGLVNNAALGTEGLLATMQNPHIEALVRLNVLSPIMLTKFVSRTMMADGGGGRIVNISSIVSFTGFNALSVYAATKSSMIGFTRSLARELGKSGITVNAVAPGFIDTEMTAGLGESGRDKIVRRSALGRLPEIRDVAAAVAYLFGESGRNVTGTVMTVDAGNTA